MLKRAKRSEHFTISDLFTMHQHLIDPKGMKRTAGSLVAGIPMRMLFFGLI